MASASAGAELGEVLLKVSGLRRLLCTPPRDDRNDLRGRRHCGVFSPKLRVMLRLLRTTFMLKEAMTKF